MATTHRRFPLIGKALALAAVLVALVLALESVSGIVAERAGRLREAERSVAASLASAQTLVGPGARARMRRDLGATQGEGKDRKTVDRAARLQSRRDAGHARHQGRCGDRAALPRHLQGQRLRPEGALASRPGTTAPRSCRRPSMPARACSATRRRCSSRSATRAACAAPRCRSTAPPSPVLAGTGHAAHPRGFHADVAESYAGAAGRCDAEVGDRARRHRRPGLRAGRRAARRSTLASDWPHPSFGGRFLPLDRQVGEGGFSARWQLNALATTAPQAAVAGAPACRLDDNAGDAGARRRRPTRALHRDLRRRLHRPGEPVRAERPRDQVRPALHRAHLRRRRRGRGDAARARPSDPVPARRLGDRGLLPAAGEPVGARRLRGRLPRRGRGVHGAAHVLRLVRAARQPRRRRSSARRSRRSTARSTRCCSSSRRRCCSAR